MVLSEQVYDYITDFQVDRLGIEEELCYVKIEEQYNILYLDRSQVAEPEAGLYSYQNIPKLYGLMQIEDNRMAFDPNNLIASGITQVQRPPLQLTGRGVIVCIIDTGERVIIMSS